MPKKDWTGTKLHRLTFIKPTDRRNGRKILWQTLCVCGNTSEVLPYTVAKGMVKSCGCFSRESITRRCEKKRIYHPIISSARTVWKANYRDGDISFDDFYRLSQLDCDYCGSPPTKTYNMSNHRKHRSSNYQIQEGNFTYNGLDRLDSNRGHMLDNVVPCCYTCNLMKRADTRKDFLSHIEKISSHSLKTGRLL